MILVLGHTKCGAVYSAVKLADAGKPIEEATGCQHLQSVLDEINPSFNLDDYRQAKIQGEPMETNYLENVAKRNVLNTVEQIISQSRVIRQLVEERKLAVVGAIYDVRSGRIEFMRDDARGLRGQVT